MLKKLSYHLDFVKKLTLKKIVNAILIYESYFISSISKVHFCWGLPTSLSIEPTSKCNLNCLECPTGMGVTKRNADEINIELFKKIIDEMHSTLIFLILYFQGEPLMNKEFYDLTKIANEKNIYTSTSTNGHFLTLANAEKLIDCGLDRLIISLDGITQETYSAYRKNGELEKVLVGIKNLVQVKYLRKSRKPFIIIQFLIFKQNQNQIEEVKILANKLGVDEVQFKSAQIYNFEKGSPLIPSIDRYSRYKLKEDKTYKIKSDLSNKCKRIWEDAVICSDGVVVPCCFDKDIIYKMGDINTSSFKSIWKSELYSTFRKKILKARRSSAMCNNCSEGLSL